MPWRWILGFVWLVAWSLAARLFLGASAEQAFEANRLGEPLTGLEAGADVRVQARVAAAPKVRGPLTKQEGVAALLTVTYVSNYRDSQDKTAWDAANVTTRTVGGPLIWLEAGGKRFALPIERFSPAARTWPGTSTNVNKLPADLNISTGDVEQAKARAKGQFNHYTLSEWLVPEGMDLFVVGRLEPGTGDLRLDKDPVLKTIELYPGMQAELVEKRRGSSAGLRIAGFLVLGLGFLPTVIFIALFLRKRLSRSPPGPATT